MSENYNYYDDPIITSQGTIILEENVDDFIRSLEQEERDFLALGQKKKKNFN